MKTKAWYTSKTLWVNVIAIIALSAQTFNADFIISPEIQAGLLGIINLILRIVTGTALEMGTSATGEQPPGPPATAGFIQIPLLFIILALLLTGFLVNGCSTTNPGAPADWAVPVTGDPAAAKDTPMQTAGKSLLAAKSTIVTAATATDGLCKAGTMAPDKCAQAKAAYELAKPAYDSAVDAYLLMSQGYGDQAALDKAITRLLNIANNLLTLSGGAN